MAGRYAFETRFFDDLIELLHLRNTTHDSGTTEHRKFCHGSTKFERWQYSEPIGQISGGESFTETNQLDGSVRAVRRIRKDPANRYRQEIGALTKFSKHPEASCLFVDFHGWFDDASSAYLITEHFELGKLERWMDHAFTETDARSITCQLLQGLSTLHEADFVHRDFHAENVYVTRRNPWLVKIGGFDSGSRPRDVELPTMTDIEKLVAYQAPEIYHNRVICSAGSEATYNTAYDIWCLGCLTYQLLTAVNPRERTPTGRRSSAERLSLNEEPLLASGVSEEAVEFVRKSLDKDQTQRVTAAAALLLPWFSRVLHPAAIELSAVNSTLLQIAPSYDVRISEHSDCHSQVAELASTSVLTLTEAPSIAASLETPMGIPVEIEAEEDEGGTFFDHGSSFMTTPIASSLNLPLYGTQTDISQSTRGGDQPAPVARRVLLTNGQGLRTISIQARLTDDEDEDSGSVSSESSLGEEIRTERFRHSSFSTPTVNGDVLDDDDDDEDAETIVSLISRASTIVSSNLPTVEAALTELRRHGRLKPRRMLKLVRDATASVSASLLPTLEFKIEQGADAALEWFLDPSRMETTSLIAQNALYRAVEEDEEGSVRVFTAIGADINQSKPYRPHQGDTPLIIAVWSGTEAMIKCLLNLGASTNIESGPKRRTALGCAASKGRETVVRYLLTAGADPTQAMPDGMTPLNLAAQQGSLAVVKVLLEQGVDVNAANHNGQTALHRAAREGFYDIVLALTQQGANIDAASVEGLTPLHVAAQCGHATIVRQLLAGGARLQAVDASRGQTPLHYAASCGYEEVMRVLLQARADTSAKDRDGQTAMHLAAFGNQVGMIRALYLYGAKCVVKDAYGETPLDLTSSAEAKRLLLSFAKAQNVRVGADDSPTDADDEAARHEFPSTAISPSSAAPPVQRSKRQEWTHAIGHLRGVKAHARKNSIFDI